MPGLSAHYKNLYSKSSPGLQVLFPVLIGTWFLFPGLWIALSLAPEQGEAKSDPSFTV